MVKKQNKTKQESRSGRQELTLIGDQIIAYLESIGGTGQRSRLAELWAHWPSSPFAHVRILGHKDGVLLVGAEDAIEAQELSMQGQEILDMANGWLGEKVFNSMRVTVQKL